MDLPPQITAWFDRRGWQVHPHQQAMLDRALDPATLLIAPTGGGKTMAGFLPTLAELAGGGHQGAHRGQPLTDGSEELIGKGVTNGRWPEPDPI